MVFVVATAPAHTPRRARGRAEEQRMEHFFQSAGSVPLDPLRDWDPSSGERCVVVPTYPPHFRLAARFLATLAAFNTGQQPQVLVVVDTPGQKGAFCAGLVEQAPFRTTSSAHQHLPCSGVQTTSLSQLLAASGEELSFTPADAAAGRLGLPVPDNLLGRNGFLGAPSGRRVSFGPLANHTLTAASASWSRRYQILKKWLGVAHAHTRLGCRLSWVVDSESLIFRPFNVTAMFESFTRRPAISVWPSAWPHERWPHHPMQAGERAGAASAASHASFSPSSTMPMNPPLSSCWGLSAEQQRLRSAGDAPTAPSIMHLFLGIAPSAWPVADLCQ